MPDVDEKRRRLIMQMAMGEEPSDPRMSQVHDVRGPQLPPSPYFGGPSAVFGDPQKALLAESERPVRRGVGAGDPQWGGRGEAPLEDTLQADDLLGAGLMGGAGFGMMIRKMAKNEAARLAKSGGYQAAKEGVEGASGMMARMRQPGYATPVGDPVGPVPQHPRIPDGPSSGWPKPETPPSGAPAEWPANQPQGSWLGSGAPEPRTLSVIEKEEADEAGSAAKESSDRAWRKLSEKKGLRKDWGKVEFDHYGPDRRQVELDEMASDPKVPFDEFDLPTGPLDATGLMPLPPKGTDSIELMMAEDAAHAGLIPTASKYGATRKDAEDWLEAVMPRTRIQDEMHRTGRPLSDKTPDRPYGEKFLDIVDRLGGPDTVTWLKNLKMPAREGRRAGLNRGASMEAGKGPWMEEVLRRMELDQKLDNGFFKNDTVPPPSRKKKDP